MACWRQWARPTTAGPSPLTNHRVADHAVDMATTSLTRSDLMPVLEAAIRAPSIHNTQPWMFQIVGDRINVFADRSRQLPVADPDGTALRVSCGAAIFNLRLGLAHLGVDADVVLVPDAGDPDRLATVITGGRRPPSAAEEALYTAVANRHSNRRPFLDTAVPMPVRALLRRAAQDEGAWLDLMIGPLALGAVSDLVGAADRILTANDAYQSELAAWTGRDGRSGDGVPTYAAGPAPRPGELLTRRDFGGPTEAAGPEFETDPLVGVLGAHSDTHRDDLIAGQALQRVLLTATSAGLVTSLMSQPIDVSAVREELRMGLRRYGSPRILLRAGYGVAATPTPRRPLAAVVRPEPLRDAPAGSFGPSVEDRQP